MKPTTNILTALPAEFREEPNAVDAGCRVVSHPALTDHMLETHHTFMKAQLLRLEALLAKVDKAHGMLIAMEAKIHEHPLPGNHLLFPRNLQKESTMNGNGARSEDAFRELFSVSSEWPMKNET